MSSSIYLEGGGNGKDQRARCREGFRRLFEKCGYAGRMPKLVACGGRDATFDDFRTAHSSRGGQYVAMLVDSEDPVENIERPWEHLHSRDTWERPDQATDEQVFLMTTCMETWIAADREAVKSHYGQGFQEGALPAQQDLEKRPRHEVHDSLAHATGNTTKPYQKGKRSFEVLGLLDPEVLKRRLPSFARMRQVLESKLS